MPPSDSSGFHALHLPSPGGISAYTVTTEVHIPGKLGVGICVPSKRPVLSRGVAYRAHTHTLSVGRAVSLRLDGLKRRKVVALVISESRKYVQIGWNWIPSLYHPFRTTEITLILRVLVSAFWLTVLTVYCIHFIM